MINKNNSNYNLFLAGLISENEYFDSCTPVELPIENKNEASNDHNDMLMSNLKTLIEHATLMLNMLEPEDQLEEWMEHKISVARAYITDVAHAFKNDKDDAEKFSGGCGNF